MFSRIKNLLFENQNLHQSIAKNTFWLFFGQIFGRLARVAIIIYAARILGPASWGAFSYATSLVAFLTIFTDIGISAIVTRESAKSPEVSNKYFSTAFFIKSVLLMLGAVLLIFGAPIITKIEEVKSLLPVAALILIFDSLRNFGFTLGRAKEKMQWEGINETLTNVAISVLGFLFLWFYPNSLNLTISYAIATAIGFLLIVWRLKPYFSSLLTHFDYQLVKPILEMAWPIALAGSLGAIMINTDIVMLGWLRTPEELGFYSAAQRPVQFLYILPALFAVSLFPVFTKLAKTSREEFKKILENSLKIVFLAALPITFGGIILGDQLINLFFGPAYQNSIASFQILLGTILIVFPSAIINNAILAHDQQKRFIAFSLVGTIGNVFFNFLLIPSFGIAGCAAATLFTQIIANSLMWKKLKEISEFEIWNKIKKPLTAAVLTAITTALLKTLGLNLIFNLGIAIIAYLLILKFQKEELFSFSNFRN
ncbi:MAG: flippase [Candidatus Harrisonbacteria bacterium]|nr:flippase [Candidatus Harrisonbacteria bacterium]